MDNAANNDSCVAALQRQLELRGISFSSREHRIRLALYFF
jgi:hypothetical protein